jgi:hypothetical protein
MATDSVSFAWPDDDGVRYERVDDLTVNIFIEGPGDTTVRPALPAMQRILERDRDEIAQLIARTRQEQEKLHRNGPPSRP